MSIWEDWWSANKETIGITLAFATGGSGLLLWSAPKDISARHALFVWVAGQLVGCATAVLVHGYLGWSAFAAPFVGLISGIAAVPFLRMVIKSSARAESRSDELADRGIDIIAGSKEKK